MNHAVLFCAKTEIGIYQVAKADMPSFHFKGKSFLQNYHHSVKFHRLDSKKSKGTSKEPSLDENLVIHGDNLKALKALLPTHAGKIKCIYIDPPYNTGNEGWVYNDNVASPMIQHWLGETVDKDDLTRHDKWCCMMYPRLILLKELLSDEGIIAISIDDNEVHHLRMMMNEIFGETNFRNYFIVRRGIKNVQAQFDYVDKYAIGAEYVLIYTKNDNIRLKQYFVELEERREGTWNNHWRGTNRPTMRYELFGIKPDSGQWRWIKKRSLEAIQNYRSLLKDLKKDNPTDREINIWFEEKKNSSIQPNLLRLSNSGKPEHYVPASSVKLGSSLWSDVNTKGSTELENIIEKKVFDNPKPTKLIERILKLFTNPDDLILDSFAGSGTTGHAVMALNKEDGGNRKFILIECEDYADKITAERIRRVSKGVPNAKDENLRKGLGGAFSYYELGPEIEMDKILEGKDLPAYEELARYAFFTATGENWSKTKLDKKKYYIGPSSTFETFLLYEPDKEKLKDLALNLDFATEINNRFPNKQKLVFAPACFMEEYTLKEFGIRFAQLPFEIYRMAE